MKKILIKSNAKINIGLSVGPKQSDGYHPLDMVMVPLAIHDSLLMSVLKNRKTNSIIMDDFSCRFGSRNLAGLAIEKLREKYHFREMFSVEIHKVIPIQGGFGGGSSNAAASLIGVNQLLGLNLSNKALEEIGLEVGSDVPFFIENKPMRCKGRGEIMSPITIKNDYFVVVAKPSDGCSTKEIYSKYDELGIKTNDIDKVIKCLENGDDEGLANCLENSLYDAAVSFVPEISKIIEILKENGAKIVSMTGSGSGVFCLLNDKKLAKKIIKVLEKNKIDCDLTKLLR